MPVMYVRIAKWLYEIFYLLRSGASARTIVAYVRSTWLCHWIVARNPANKRLLDHWRSELAHGDFSAGWFDEHIPVWSHLFGAAAERGKFRSILEIGSWEGRSTLFMLSRFEGSAVTVVDTWQGGDEHRGHPGLRSIEQRFDSNLSPYVDRLRKLKALSTVALGALVEERQMFDLIYLDGSHHAQQVMIDSVLCWCMLKQNGVMIFDDYTWRQHYDHWRDNPAWAVDHFLRFCAKRHRLLFVGKQLILRRTA